MKRHGLRKIVTVGPHIGIDGAPPAEEDAGAWHVAWDDVSGQELDPTEVARARAKEMEYVDKKGVWAVIPRSRRRQMDGKSSPPDG